MVGGKETDRRLLCGKQKGVATQRDEWTSCEITTPYLTPWEGPQMGKLIQDLALGQNAKTYTERGDFPCAACGWVVTGKITSRGGCCFALQPLGRPALFPHSRAARCQRVGKVSYGRKTKVVGIRGVGVRAGLALVRD